MGNTKKKINYLRKRKITKKRTGNRVQKGRGLENMTDNYLAYLDEKLKNNIVKDDVLEYNMLDKDQFSNPIQYVLNKLNLLYSIDDKKNITVEDLKGVSKDNGHVQKVIKDTENFINNDLPGFNISLDTTYFVMYHGGVRNYMVTVPKDTIIVFMSPTNRLFYSNEINFNNIIQNITDTKFLNEYIKNPNCLPELNKCFSYAHICYPGQKLFDVYLYPLSDSEIRSNYNYHGIMNATKLKTGIEKQNFEGLTEQHEKPTYLSKIINDKPGLYFIYSCRSCEFYLKDYITECIYYHEDMITFVNKASRDSGYECTLKQDVQTCSPKIFGKLNKINTDSSFIVPKLNFSPIYKLNNKIESKYNEIKTIFFYGTNIMLDNFISKLKRLIKDGESFFSAFVNINQYTNFAITPKYYNNIKTIFMFDTKFSDLIKEYIMNEDGVMVDDARENIIKIIEILKSNNNNNRNIILRLFLTQLVYYYLVEYKQMIITDLTNLFMYNDILSLCIYLNPKANNTNSYNIITLGEYFKDEFNLDHHFDNTLYFYYIQLKEKLYTHKIVKSYYLHRAFYCVKILNSNNDIADIFNELRTYPGSLFELLKYISIYIDGQEFIDTISKFNHDSIYYKLFTCDDSVWKEFTDSVFSAANVIYSYVDTDIDIDTNNINNINNINKETLISDVYKKRLVYELDYFIEKGSNSITILDLFVIKMYPYIEGLPKRDLPEIIVEYD